MKRVVKEIESNHGNLQQLLTRELHGNNPNLADAIYCTISLSSFNRMTGRGRLLLMDHIPAVLPHPVDYRLEAYFLAELFKSAVLQPLSNPELLIAQVLSHLSNFHDPVFEGMFIAMCLLFSFRLEIFNSWILSYSCQFLPPKQK